MARRQCGSLGGALVGAADRYLDRGGEGQVGDRRRVGRSAGDRGGVSGRAVVGSAGPGGGGRRGRRSAGRAARCWAPPRTDSLRELRNESRRAQAVDDEEGRQRRIHERRRLRMGVDTDGTFRLSFSGTAVAGAAIVAALRPFTDQAFKQAKKEGRVESHAAYQADGFVAMAQAAAAGGVDGAAKPKKSNVKVIVVVDVAALRRGAVEHGETCEIRGVGPVPVVDGAGTVG